MIEKLEEKEISNHARAKLPAKLKIRWRDRKRRSLGVSGFATRHYLAVDKRAHRKKEEEDINISRFKNMDQEGGIRN